jgi:hypothetical protein
MRRGTTSRHSPAEEVDKVPDLGPEVHSPDTYTTAASRKNSFLGRSGSTLMGSPLQTAGFKTTSTFQQQNRWMTPLHVQTESAQTSPTSTHYGFGRRESYNTMPPMNSSNGAPSNMLDNSLATYDTTHGSASAYSHSFSHASSQGNVSVASAYEGKLEPHYL